MEFNATQPIWLQLTEEFRRRIVAGSWVSGQRIPSVRELAAELNVNPNTVQKALTELDRLGLTESERAVGRRVTTSDAKIVQLRRELSQQLADQYVHGVKGIGLSRDDAVARVEFSWAQLRFSGERKEEK